MKGVLIIGMFRPVGLPAESNYSEWVERFGRNDDDDMQVRPPCLNLSSDKQTVQWHRDCGAAVRDNGFAKTVLFWANMKPIEFKRNGRIWSPKPYTVVMFDNTDPVLEHRRPPGITIEDGRWSIVDRRHVIN